ncbi:MAG: hypothetical protein M3N17_07855 [Actinomycetota bacterium]|nr:hypothetical protein [Actinomycetota bacterium]
MHKGSEGREHRELVERMRSFGVPTIVLDGGAGPATFGPVISRLPDDDGTVALWRHCRGWHATRTSWS